jgi:hypothetical protein
MEEDKIPTAENEFKELLFRLDKCFPDKVAVDCTNTITYALELIQKEKIEFARIHVKKALDAAKKVNPQCVWDDNESCYLAVQNEYGIEKCYPLEYIK